MLSALAALGFSGDAKPTTWRDLAAKNYDHSFDQYLADYNKFYVGAEYDERKAVYTAALAKIKAHNSDPTHTWKMGLSPHADKTEAEWKAMKGYNRHQVRSARGRFWRNSGAIL